MSRKRPELTTNRVAVLMMVLALILIGGGVLLVAGPGWALVTVGCLMLVAGVLLYDTKPAK